MAIRSLTEDSDGNRKEQIELPGGWMGLTHLQDTDNEREWQTLPRFVLSDEKYSEFLNQNTGERAAWKDNKYHLRNAGLYAFTYVQRHGEQ